MSLRWCGAIHNGNCVGHYHGGAGLSMQSLSWPTGDTRRMECGMSSGQPEDLYALAGLSGQLGASLEKTAFERAA